MPESLTGAKDAPARIRLRVVRCATLSAALLAAIGIAGWWIGLSAATRIQPHFPPMVPNTAVALLALSASIWLSVGFPASRLVQSGADAAAAVAGLVAGLTLAEYASGWDAGIDHLLLPAAARGAPLAGRPSINAGVAVVCLTVGLVLRHTGRRGARRAGEALAWLAVATAFVAVVGYVYGVPPLYGLPGHLPQTGLAVTTAIALLFLGSAVSLIYPDSPVYRLATSRFLGGEVARRLAATALVLPLVGLLTQLGVQSGLYRPELGTAILVTSATVIGAFVILVVGQRLDTVDVARAQAVEQLRRAGSQLRTLFAQASDAMFVADLDGRYTEVNAAGCRLLGRPAEEIVGRSITDFIAPKDVPRLWSDREYLLAGGVQVSDWRLMRSDGAYVDAEVSARILPDGRWLGLVRDVSAQRAAQETLARAHETERQLRHRLETASEATLAIAAALADIPSRGLSHVLNVIARQSQVLTGAEFVAIGIGTDPDVPFDPFVSIGMLDSMAAAVGHTPRPVGLLGKVAREGRALRVRDASADPEYRGTPPGHPRIGSLMGVPIRFRGKSVGNIYVANKQGAAEFSDVDLTLMEIVASRAGTAIETASLYDQQARERAWLQAVIDQMPEGVVLANASGTLVHRNRAAQELFGAREHEGALRIDLRSPDGRPMSAGEIPLARAVATGESTDRLELVVPGPAGTLIPITVSACPVQDAQGRRLGGAMLLHDISVFKELERLREEWASIVAHDLRQPLTATTYSLKVLRAAADRLSPPERDALERSAASMVRMGTMIQDLLDMSRLEARRMRIEAQRFDVIKLARDVVDGLGGREARINLVFSSDAVMAWADPNRVTQVLGNLLSNARKHGSPGTPITVGIEARGQVVEVRVANQGSGIPPDEIPRLFTRFARARRTQAEDTPGLGLGLYIAKGLVEAQGGRIWAESIPGATTTFSFTLPASPLAASSSSASAA
ncbi:MAG TPA: ATP-binding protein [Candidatus Acidoferrum sp.]|nr:ATP-binding protein [Candidatus Acidoferrum sp.]